ncbi:rhomboid family intramembrane serine protease [Profundibacterium mesophilum]|uniref:Rhomboid-like protein n=1 Tax=Profundibacterium mesophilum KAUST100406-0324 TaxID=1037889 RepID=A0A921TC76_9RHOB|nr:rhomboid family intramembrane serine protease [Profundibacterium mesophilum]KAF0676755.1 Rhomboid-like protein [Profundibacterium mesophilum KAUST100406-0324]
MLPIRDHTPSATTPWVTYGLILVNVAIFLLLLPLEGNPRALTLFYYDWALIPAIADPVTFLSSQFLHGGFWHIAGNMLFLFIFGDNIEDELGHALFLAFYLAAGVAAGLAQTLFDPTSTVPMVGASGAIAGVMGGYLLLFPRARIDVLLILIVFFKVIPVPAWAVLSLWLILQIVSGAGTAQSGGGIAYWAHVGGFLAGLALLLPLWARRGGPLYWRRSGGVPPHPPADSVAAVPLVRRRR